MEPTKPRVLLVEDNLVLSMALEAVLESLGIDVVGPADNLEDGLALATSADIDAAILDVKLDGESCLPIAEALEARGCPFAFTTGYSTVGEDGRWSHVPVLTKPVFKAELERGLGLLLGAPLRRDADEP